MGFLKDKRALITGIISNRSIAFGIAKAMHREGAILSFTYQNEKLGERVKNLVSGFNPQSLIAVDVENDEEIDNLFIELNKVWDSLDIIVHSIAFAPIEQLQGDYLEKVNRAAFLKSHSISSYSFAALAKGAQNMLRQNSALLTLSYIGSERAVPNYNVMGVAKASLEANMRYMAASLGKKSIRVNAISPGPIKTLAASGVKNLRALISSMKNLAPLRENVTIDEVGNVAAFLCSDLARGITGEVIHVDGGFHSIIPMLNDED